MSSLVDKLVAPVLASGRPIPGMLQTRPQPEPPARRLDSATLDAIAADRRNIGALHANVPHPSRAVALHIPSHVADAIGDQLERVRATGSQVEPGRMLEDAIGRMLDAMERTWWCRTCLESSEHCGCRAKAAK